MARGVNANTDAGRRKEEFSASGRNNRNFALRALGRFTDKAYDATVGKYHDSKKRGSDRKYKAYKAVNDAGGSRMRFEPGSDLFKAAASMRNERYNQKKALERS